MNKVRARIVPLYLKTEAGERTSTTYVDAVIVKTNERGWLTVKALPKGKYRQMIRDGYAYTNIYSQQIV